MYVSNSFKKYDGYKALITRNALNAIRYFPNAIKSFIFEFEQFVFWIKLLPQTLSFCHLFFYIYYFKKFLLLKISNVHVISFYKKQLYKKQY